MAATATVRRPRHAPKETEREILDAAEALLRERPFREVTVGEVMRHTGLKRPAFYVHFRDRNDLVLRVVQRIAAELLEMSDRWLMGDQPEADVRAALDGVAAVFQDHGPVLRALSDAAGSDAQVESAYRSLVQTFIDVTARRIREDQAAGRTGSDLDPDEVARALVWMNERYLSEALGRQPQTDLGKVVDTLTRIWVATLYA